MNIIKKGLAIVLTSTLLVSSSMPVFAASPDTHVIITKTGKCYHTSKCSTLKKTQIEVTMQEAVDKGLRECKVCKPGTID